MKAQHVLGIGCALAFSAALFLDGAPAGAFPFENSWHLASSGETNTTPKNRCGAGGIYGLGSPADFGIKCSDCHIDAQAAFQVQIDESPDFMTSGNTKLYQPGQTYDIQISIINEVHAMDENSNLTLNGFTASFEAADGAAMGVLVADLGRSDSCPANAPTAVQNVHNRTMVYGDCHAVLSEPEVGDSSWTFQWIAPQSGSGDVTMWYGVVDGDHHDKSSLDDDTVQGNLLLSEG